MNVGCEEHRGNAVVTDTLLGLLRGLFFIGEIGKNAVLIRDHNLTSDRTAMCQILVKKYLISSTRRRGGFGVLLCAACSKTIASIHVLMLG